jgi:hypothetical protein
MTTHDALPAAVLSPGRSRHRRAISCVDRPERTRKWRERQRRSCCAGRPKASLASEASASRAVHHLQQMHKEGRPEPQGFLMCRCQAQNEDREMIVGYAE